MARALMHFFAQVGLPKAVLMDRGSPFTSSLMKRMCQMLGISRLFAVVQHPQTEGLIERLNQTLKGMLAKATTTHPKSWDLCVDPILFALRESPQVFTGFAPFEFVYGQKPRGLLEVLEGRPQESADPVPQDAGQYLT